MKTSKIFQMGVGLTAAWLAMAAQADFKTTFATPPYTVGGSVIGTDGWQPRMADTPDNGGARVELIRWNNYQPALVLRTVSLKNSLAAPVGGRVKVTIKFAVAFPDRLNLPQIRFIVGGSPFQEVVFEASENGGIGFANGSGRDFRLILSKQLMKPNTFYTFSSVIDFDGGTYSYEVTGMGKSGAMEKVEVKDQPITTKGKEITGLLLMAGDRINNYVSEFAVESL